MLSLQGTCFTGIWSEMVLYIRGVGVIAIHLSRVSKVIRVGVITQSSLTFESRLGSTPAETTITQEPLYKITQPKEKAMAYTGDSSDSIQCVKALISLGSFDCAVEAFV